MKIFSIPKYLSLGLIKIYQILFSLDHSFWAKGLNIGVCRFHPTCSEYTYQAVQKHGALKGGIMGFFRILRCNPFFRGGSDPVPDKFSIKRNSKT